MKPICVPCQRFFRQKKSGYYFIEGMPSIGHGAKRGREAGPDDWRPYKLWAGDLWECPDCKAQIVSGIGLNPISEHYREDFGRMTENLGAAQLMVKDC